jgi:hypothetical protein
MALREIRADLADVEAELSGAYLVRSRQVKHSRRALAALDAAARGLDAAHPRPAAPRRRTVGKAPSLLLTYAEPDQPSL